MLARKTNKPDRPDNLIREALDFINLHSGGNIQGCFHKERGRLVTFGVYNTITKKYAIFHTVSFYPDDLLDIKRVVLDRVE